MRSRTVVAVSCAAVCLAFLATGGSAAAAPKPITGTLSAPGYTVIALAVDGKATSERVSGRSFRLRPPAQRVTLHLRAKDGTYAGPIVVGAERKGMRAIVGVRAGAKLGTVRINRRMGYAKPVKKLAEKWADATRGARARKGVPIGAGNFGLVRSRRARGPAADPDLDGVPSPLDIDDDGDRTLDTLEIRRAGAARARATGAGAAQVPQDEGLVGLGPILSVPIPSTTNANAAGLTPEQGDRVFAEFARLGINILPGDTAELDCGGRPDPRDPAGWSGGLSYCSRGGTGGVFLVPAPSGGAWPEFPEAYDPDGDGFGTLTPSNPGTANMFLVEGGPVAEVRSGDVLIERVTNNGVETAYPATLPMVFGTVPALASYRDETMAFPQAISYPVAQGAPGTFGNGLPVSDGAEDPDPDVEATFTFWRPQRLRTPGDPGRGQWMDIGALTYTVAGFFGPGGRQFCPQGAFSTTDPSLTPPPAGFPVPAAFTDVAPDRPADPGSTLTFTVNLTQCLAANGVPFAPGDQVGLILRAHGGNGIDKTEQQFFVKRQ